MKRTLLLLTCSSLFVLLTSVYCTREYTCSGIVYESGTTTPLDSVLINAPGNDTSTNAQGKYWIKFKTSKSPTLEFWKYGYTSKDLSKCKLQDTIELEY